MLKKIENDKIMIALTQMLYIEANKSLFAPIVKPIEKINTTIAANVTLLKSNCLFSRNIKPSSIPAISEIIRFSMLSISSAPIPLYLTGKYVNLFRNENRLNV